MDVGDIQKKILFVGRSGWCVSMMAAYSNAPAPVWKALIEAALRVGLDLQFILIRGNVNKSTVLHHAAWKSQSGDEVSCCLSFLCPSALDMKDVNNRTPLEVAKRWSRPSSVIAALTQAVNDRAGFQKQQLELNELIKCLTGKASTSDFTGCQACNPGKYLSGKICLTCGAGKYAEFGAAQLLKVKV